MEPDKVMSFPTYINNEQFHEQYMSNWDLYNEDDVSQWLLPKEEKREGVFVEKISTKAFVKIYINGYMCYINKKQYDVLKEFDFENNFEKMVCYSDVVIEEASGNILKFKHPQVLKTIIDGLFCLIGK